MFVSQDRILRGGYLGAIERDMRRQVRSERLKTGAVVNARYKQNVAWGVFQRIAEGYELLRGIGILCPTGLGVTLGT